MKQENRLNKVGKKSSHTEQVYTAVNLSKSTIVMRPQRYIVLFLESFLKYNIIERSLQKVEIKKFMLKCFVDISIIFALILYILPRV